MASSSNCGGALDHGIAEARTIVVGTMTRYIPCMRFEKVWVEQCRATKMIKRRFGAKGRLIT
jgi:hypothetical protein